MKTRSLLLISLLCSFVCLSSCRKEDTPPADPDSGSGDGEEQVEPERNGESGITYQLLVYSFADSDGDGTGDFRGIEQKLDYLKDMGVQALWLSPIHEASSYHGYDVLDYKSVNHEYGTEADFKSLVSAAHAKGIRIYIDYVLNHTSKDHPWFLDAKSGPDSKYRDCFIFSDNPKADIAAGKIPMIATEGAGGYDSGQWYTAVSSSASSFKVNFTLELDSAGKPSTLTAVQTGEVSNSGTPDSGIYLYYGDGQMAQFYRNGGACTLSLEFSTSWGILVRTSTTTWDGGTKFGAPMGKNSLSWGEPLKLSTSDAQDILMPGTATTMYHSHFWTSYMADINYGPASTCEESFMFKALTEAADKWIGIGVDGFRLDAVKHIYHNADSDENPIFLKKFYDHCNASFKAAGGKGDFYMVGEQFSDAPHVAPYYKGIPALFEFSFWWTLSDCISSGTGNSFVSTIQGFTDLYGKYRSDFIEATKLSNHDEDRTGSTLGRSLPKMKLAGAVLLTAGGQPYIYQGEELGYYGTKQNGDEYVRTPIMWNADGRGLASAKLSGKTDKAMLTSSISVESQSAAESSILNVYRKFGIARDTYKALSQGTFEYCPSATATPVAAWYRSFEGQKVLVVHNFSAGNTNMNFPGESLDNIIVSNGTVSVSGNKLTLGGYSSVVFLL